MSQVRTLYKLHYIDLGLPQFRVVVIEHHVRTKVNLVENCGFTLDHQIVSLIFLTL